VVATGEHTGSAGGLAVVDVVEVGRGIVVVGRTVVDDVAGSVDDVGVSVDVVASAGGAGCVVSVGSSPRDDTRCSDPPRAQAPASNSAARAVDSPKARRDTAVFVTFQMIGRRGSELARFAGDMPF
jgi:hypothetical protein